MDTPGIEFLIGIAAAEVLLRHIVLNEGCVLIGGDHGHLDHGIGRTLDIHRSGVHGVHDHIIREDIAHPVAAQGHALGAGTDCDRALPHAGQ